MKRGLVLVLAAVALGSVIGSEAIPGWRWLLAASTLGLAWAALAPAPAPSAASPSEAKTAEEKPLEQYVEGLFEELARSREELLSSRDYNERILRSIGNMMVVMDQEGQIQSVNQATVETLGYQESELVGNPFRLIVAESSPKQDLMFTGSVRHIEAIYRHKNGEDIPVFFSCSVVRDPEGEMESIVTIAQDISERKRAEEELMASERRFRAIFASSAIGMAQLRPPLELTNFNRAMRKMLAYRQSVTSAELGDLLDPQALERYRKSLVELLNGEREVVQFECRFRRADDSWIWGNAIVSLVKQSDKAHQFGIMMLEDITRRKEAEAALEGAKEQLQTYASSLEEKEAHLSLLLEKLVHSQEEERRLVANDLHDGVLQYVIAAEMHLKAFQNSVNEHPNTNLDRGLQRLREAVTEGRRLIFNLRPSSLDDFGLEETLRRQLETMEKDGCETRFDYDVSTLPPPAETAVYRIVQEALNNILRHAEADSVSVELKTSGENLEVRVKDNGKGFDPAQGSDGVGLVAMKERAQFIGGSLELRSQPGGPTTVAVTIPTRNLSER